jgi:hypothetical protein
MNWADIEQPTEIWPELYEALCKTYDIVGSADLIAYDHDMSILYQYLKKFKSYTFLSNQRLIFSFYDTEYYLPQSKIGFTIENLMQIIDSLDISSGYCLLFTNHHGLKESIEKRYKSNIIVIENNFSYLTCVSTPPVIVRTCNDIDYHFCFMSHQKRLHRCYLRLWLEEMQCVKKTVLSWHTEKSQLFPDTPQAEKSTVPTNDIFFVYTFPFTRCRDKIFPSSDKLGWLYQKHSHVLEVMHRNTEIYFGPGEDQFYAPWLAKTFINLVTETVFDYPYPYLTEKTFNCFWHLSPFIIIGAPNSLTYLKSIGFKTFDQWIDESYDEIKDPELRLMAVFSSIQTISNWSLSHCRDVYNEMLPVLNYNLEHFKNNFCKDLLEENKKILGLI